MQPRSPDSQWKARASQVIAQGALTNSKRWAAYVENVFPTHFLRGEGCYLYDASGNRYLDFIGGLGTNLIGYGNPKITEAVQKVLPNGPSLSFPSTLEVELAERLCLMTGFPKVRFYKTGTEACMAAVRIGRALRGQDNMYMWSEGYHGWSDGFVSLTSPALGIACGQKISQTHEGYKTDHPDYCGAVIEPLMLEVTDSRKLWLQSLKSSDILIFDEIITGFRVPQQFVFKWWNITPDILVIGKAMANGYPLAAVFMSNEAADIEWFASGTYCGELTALAACNATMDEIEKRSINDLWFYANRFMDNANKLLAEIDVKIQGYGTRGFLPLETLNEALFLQEACKAGVLFGKAFFYGYSHLEAGIDETTLALIGDIVIKIKGGKVKLEGKAPQSSFRRY